uniref:Uncharacterized protein n=1 Tax=Tanacetum cinerariifolium TaxID=118510 RepID=A0A6L2K3J5_TANCI|nr:hypothetical protein [Tanacetum cinerariifolium]
MLVLVREDGILVKLMNVNGEASAIDHFLCFLTRLVPLIQPSKCILAASAIDTPSNNGEDGLINGIKSNKMNSMRHVSCANLLNGEQSKKAPNFRTLIAPAGNVPLIIRKWSPLTNIAKEYLKSGRSSIAGAITDIHVDVELKDTLVVVVPKIEVNQEEEKVEFRKRCLSKLASWRGHHVFAAMAGFR